MSTEKFVEYVKTNKRSIIKRSLITIGVTAGIVLTVVLLKKDKESTEEYLNSVEQYLDTTEKRLDEIIGDTDVKLDVVEN